MGRQLLLELLLSEKWGKVLTFTRRDYELPPGSNVDMTKEVESGRLVKKIINFEDIEKEKESFQGYSYVFSCLGSTRKDAGGAEEFMHIDHGYNIAAAKLAKEASIPHYSICSAANANANSYFTYPRCKGLIEKDLQALDFDTLSIFRPGVLNRGDMARWNEKIICIGAIPVSVVAHAMRVQAELVLEHKIEEKKVYTYSNSDMRKM